MVITLMHAAIDERAVFIVYLFCASVLVLLVTALLKTQSSLIKCLKECETQNRKLAKRSGDAILHNAADGTVPNASPSIKGLTGIDAAVLFDFNARPVVHTENVEIVWNSHLRALASRHIVYSLNRSTTGMATLPETRCCALLRRLPGATIA